MKKGIWSREGYIDYTAKNWDLRLGRQVITWGLGDLLFINDVFPKDYEAFFSGRPLEYFKNIFGGSNEWSQFGSFDKNDNLYLQFRYEF